MNIPMQEAINHLFGYTRPNMVVETGTHKGQGTTSMLWRARSLFGLETKIATIECNPAFYTEAVKHFHYNSMEINSMLGLSIPRSMLPSKEKIKEKYVDNEDTMGGKIHYDHDREHRVESYWNEVNPGGLTVSDNLLGRFFGAKVDVYLLDSAGHVGDVEFRYVMRHAMRPFYLIMDDTKHCKHVGSVQLLKSYLSCSVIVESDDRFGFAIARCA